MKAQKRMLLIGVALVAMVLVAAAPAAARSGLTRFEAIAYVCEMDDPLVHWDDAAGAHDGGIILRERVVSDEPRMAGVMIDLIGQDMISTGFFLWGTGTFVVGANEGTWYTTWTAKATDEGLVSRAFGYGKDGLEGQVVFWEGKQLFEFEPPVGCDAQAVMEFTGFIRGGPRH